MLCDRGRTPTRFCRRRTSQRHTARNLGSEVRIYYPFHPRAGQAAEVVARAVHGGVSHLTIVQGDGTLAKIPAWMTEKAAGTASIVEFPALSIAALFEVRAVLESSLGSGDEESTPDSGGEHDSTPPPSTASVRCPPHSCGDPAGAPHASSQAHRGTSAGSGPQRGASTGGSKRNGGDR